MKILFFIPSMSAGGSERVIATLANEMSKKGNKTIILTINPGECFYELSHGVVYESLNLNSNYSNRLLRNLMLPGLEMKRIFSVYRFIKQNSPDVIISFTLTSNIILLTLRGLISSRVIVSERSDPTKYSFLVKSIVRHLYIYSDKIVCQSEKVASFFGDENYKKVKVIPNPLSLKFSDDLQAEKKEKKIVTVGRLIEIKNPEMAIRAFYKICDEFSDYSLEIYGDGPLKSKLREIIRELGLDNRVILMGTRKDVHNLIHNAKLFLFSSYYEGFPNALIEAMSLGIPVVTTDFDSGIAKELVCKFNNGLLVPVNDVDAMAEAIKRILSNNILQVNMSVNAHKLREEYSPERINNMWLDTINSISNKSSKRGKIWE